VGEKGVAEDIVMVKRVGKDQAVVKIGEDNKS